jgi:hypothetical protein
LQLISLIQKNIPKKIFLSKFYFVFFDVDTKKAGKAMFLIPKFLHIEIPLMQAPLSKGTF